jgi:hypothetical protein
MAAYVIAEITVTDPEGYEPYKALAEESIHAHGGRYLVRGGTVSRSRNGPRLVPIRRVPGGGASPPRDLDRTAVPGGRAVNAGMIPPGAPPADLSLS